VGYLIWSALVMRIIRLPLGWIYRHLHGIPDENHIDQQLMILESQVKPFCQVAIAASLIAIVISALVYFT